MWCSPEPTARTAITLEKAEDVTGLPDRFAGRLFYPWELARPQPDQAIRADVFPAIRPSAEELAIAEPVARQKARHSAW